MRKFFKILSVALVVSLFANPAHASFLGEVKDFITGVFVGSPMDDLTNNVVRLAELVNKSTSDMMKFGDMLLCSSLHGSAADISIGVGPLSIDFKVISISLWFSGAILYMVGFVLMMMSSYYLFDAAFNLSISIVLLPLALSLWPFAWTRDNLKKVVDSIVYYIGVFIFLPLGVLMAKEIAFTVVNNAFIDASGFDFMTAYREDKGDLLEDELGLFCMTFLKVLLCFIVAVRIIPLMAMDFCKYFFGESLVQTPIADRITDVAKSGMKQAKKGGKFAKDVGKHQLGNKINSLGNSIGGNIGGAIARLGTKIGTTRRN